jgi:hypothetical protein
MARAKISNAAATKENAAAAILVTFWEDGAPEEMRTPDPLPVLIPVKIINGVR